MKLVETTLTQTAMRVRLADNMDPAQAKSWVDFQFPLSSLLLGSGTPVGDPNLRRLALVHQAALRAARNAIDDEIRRFESLASASPP